MTEAEHAEQQRKQRQTNQDEHLEGLTRLAYNIPIVAKIFHEQLVNVGGFTRPEATELTAAWIKSL